MTFLCYAANDIPEIQGTNIMIYLCYAIMVLVPYLLCGVNTAIIVTKIKSGEDIRKLGSGNPGLTNTLRTQGKIAALFVLIGDVAKGVLSIILVWLSFLLLAGIDPHNKEIGCEWVLYAAGVFATLGHMFPIYYGFKGGKGVLVTVAVLLAIDWPPAVILFGLFALIVAITRYVSLGSCIAAFLYPFAVLIFGIIESNPSIVLNIIFSAIIGAMIIIMHRQNIKRLINHTEKKLGQKSST